MEYYTLAAPTQKYSNSTKRQYVSYKNGDVYNAEHIFKLEKNLGQIKNQFIKISISITTDKKDIPINFIRPFGSSIIKTYELNSSSGILHSYSNLLLESRLALLKNTPLGNKIDSGQISEFIQGVISPTTETYTVTLPLMWFFTDTKNDFFTNSVNTNENYFMRFITNDSMVNMGLGTGFISVNSISIDLINECITLPIAQMNTLSFPTNGYSSFNEGPVNLPYLSTSAKISLKCIYKTFATHFIIKGNDGSSEFKIKSVTIRGPKGYHREITDTTNYSLWNNNNFYSQDLSTSFSVFFGSRYDNYDTENYICYDPQSTPYEAEIEFDEIYTGGSAILYCISEYHTKFTVSNNMVSMSG